MLKPNASHFQATGSMADSLEFIKSLWGNMGVPGLNMGTAAMPGMVLPTLSVEELRKKIAELRAVESWLELNMNMLRSSIQALEVQAATIATLQSMGQSLNAATSAFQTPPKQDAAKPAASHPHDEHAAEPTAEDEAEAAALTAPIINAATWWTQLQDQFKQAVANAMEEMPKSNGHDTSSSAAQKTTRARKTTAGAAAKTARKPKSSK